MGVVHSGKRNPNWRGGRSISSHGYVLIRVGVEHPLADPNGYAYEHLVVWVSAGRQRPPKGWLLHHANEVKSDNRLSNLELKRKTKHGVDHASPLSDDEVFAIRAGYASGDTTTMLARAYSVPHQTISKLIKGRTRLDAGGPIQNGDLRTQRRRNARPEVPAL